MDSVSRGAGDVTGNQSVRMALMKQRRPAVSNSFSWSHLIRRLEVLISGSVAEVGL